MAWRIEFFETSRGSSPPRDFLRGLPPKAQAKLARAIDLVEEYGPEMGQPYVKAVRGRKGLLELRTSLGSDAFRLFFFRAGKRQLIVAHGFRKKTQKTPAQELDTAQQRMGEYLRGQR
ncbi:MAG: type II toxin-antitoxin system RelE/ParE family toxin [Dehalococcoidia bacterium]|nr:type II toxin-antitoxin system RelE/ParE family toxin [Dehalococcoidia bacterium]